MTQQETGGAGTAGSGTGEPSLTEEVEEVVTETPAVSTDAVGGVPLNRAERRAQAKGKKGGPASGPGQPLAGGGRGGVAKTSGHAGQVRFPRTGHK